MKCSRGIMLGRLRLTHLQIFGLEKRGMGNDGHVDNVFECKIEHKAAYLEHESTRHRALKAHLSDRCRTAVTVTGGTVDGYALLFESFDDPAHALPRVLRGMFTQPRGEIKVCLESGRFL
jgi:hypothetical protein